MTDLGSLKRNRLRLINPTAAQMGVKQGEKHYGKVDSALTGEHIGISKRKHANSDPYRAGKHSGKHAKPNAVSIAANTRACVAASVTDRSRCVFHSFGGHQAGLLN
jgi:translation elongation factor EF-1alpha